jgi:hypothetical protein
MSQHYIYQPGTILSDYQQAVDILRSRYATVKTQSVDPRPHLDEIAEHMRSIGSPVMDLKVSAPEFAEYFWRAEYALRYTNYYRGNLPEKALEHFVALQLLKPRPNDVFIDIASEGSPLPEIAARLHGCAAYAQDIMYDAGINDAQIGGDACCMPVQDGFAACATLTCSLEHFEGDADTRLFLELQRVLCPEGRVVVVPLYIFREAAVQTDPTYSAALDIPFDSDVPIYCARGWKNRHARWYSAETLRSRIMDVCSQMSFEVYRLRDTEGIHPSIYARFCLLGKRL